MNVDLPEASDPSHPATDERRFFRLGCDRAAETRSRRRPVAARFVVVSEIELPSEWTRAEYGEVTLV